VPWRAPPTIAILIFAGLLLALLAVGCGTGGTRSGELVGSGGLVGLHSGELRTAGRFFPTRTARQAPPPSGEPPEVHRLIALGKPVYCAGRHGKDVALTFDDGPGPYTRLALRKLRSWGDRATFFIVGRNIPLIPGITRRERALGMVGDHTFTHPVLTALPTVEAEREIVRTQAALARASGRPVFLFRPPYGARDARIDSIARRHGLLEILWSVDSADSLGANYAEIAHNVIAGLKPGAIILMHENRGQTIRALATILPALRRLQLRAVSVPELLNVDPPSRAQVRAGWRGCGVGGAAPRGGD
jgi:peptidoglycan/xylan/chitin deacetylase (PgdA/CDA1 family)